MIANRCERCGANLALVGSMHRCVPRQPQPRQDQPSGTNAGGGIEAKVIVQPAPDKPSPATYSKYKDKDKRRAYMRDYMRARRAAKP